MKNVFTLLLALVMCLSILVACGEPEPIELTQDNISQYLRIRAYFDSNYETERKIVGYFGYGRLIIECYPVQKGSFQNVSFVVQSEINSESSWDFSSSDPAYEENRNPKRICSEFILPASGEMSNSHRIIACDLYGYPEAPFGEINLLAFAVTGTFIPG